MILLKKRLRDLISIFLILVLTVFMVGFLEAEEPLRPIRPKLRLITPYGDDMAYHPSVVSFEEEWNGYKYWIAFTPYPSADATKENPVINASNDLFEWCVPKGLKNPIDTPTPLDKYHYNSDTHLIFNEKENRLELFWRYVCDDNGKAGSVTIFRSVSYDGVHWEPKTEFFYSEKRRKNDWLSPAIILKDDVYCVWYVGPNNKVNYLEVKDGKIGEPTKIELEFENGLKPWHLDVIYNKDKDLYEMIVCPYTDQTDRSLMSLYYSYSKNNQNWTAPKEILKPTDQAPYIWDSLGLYRASLVYTNNQYYLFYSAHSVYKLNVGVGLVCGPDIYSLKGHI